MKRKKNSVKPDASTANRFAIGFPFFFLLLFLRFRLPWSCAFRRFQLDQNAIKMLNKNIDLKKMLLDLL